MDRLPAEIILNCCKFLDPLEIIRLQHVCKRFLLIGRDDGLWRGQCFQTSSFLERLRRTRDLLSSEPVQEPQFRELARALANGNGLGHSRLVESRGEAPELKAPSDEKIRILANWDPSYPDEKVRWYDEYIARNAPISTNWLQQPRHRENPRHEHLEIRGMGLYTEPGDSDSTLVVGPLDDGSLCIWDIEGTKGQKGSIIARSKSAMLFLDDSPTDGRPNYPKLISAGVTECVSIDNTRQRAYIAVQDDLVEVDLQTLSPVSREKFPFTITALSEAKHPVPLTVGTNLSLHLHDPRTKASSGHRLGDSDRLDSNAASFTTRSSIKTPDFRSLLNPNPSPVYTHLNHAGPLSILHLPSSAGEWDGNGEIYVAGRFPSILNYDRRYFPKLRGTIHSGARLCSMTSLPYPFASTEKDLTRRGELSVEQVWEAKTRPGKTLIAAGEYNSKGSLEMYGLSPDPYLSTISTNPMAGSLQNSVMKNRQTSSSSKLLSVANHGTRVVISDGSGNLKWLERDGFTEARKWNSAREPVDGPGGLFSSTEASFVDPQAGDVIIKLSNTHNGRSERPVNEDDLVMWTGEKIGLLSFSREAGFTADSFEEKGRRTEEEARIEKEEHDYSQTMRRALEKNADEVRFMRGLGLGGSRLP